MRVGDAYTYPFTSSVILRHPWVVIAKPTRLTIAVVNFTTWKPGCDEACVAVRWEHPLLTHEKSVGRYDGAKVLEERLIEDAIRAGIVTVHPDQVSPELLLKLQNGALDSENTPTEVQDAVRVTLGS